MVDTVGRILRITGDKRRACLVHAEHTAEEAAFSGQQEGYAVAGLDAPADQVVGDDIGAFVELAIGEGLVQSDQRGFVRIFFRGFFKELVQQGDAQLLCCRCLKAVELFLLISGQCQRVTDGHRVAREQ